MEIETVKISSLKPHPGNPRNHPDSAIDMLDKSLRQFGWTNPVLVSEDGFVLAGHARLKAAKKIGIEDIPIIRLPLSGKKADAYMVADNKLAALTEWDFPKLTGLLTELDTGDFDMESIGFSAEELEKLMTYSKEDIDEVTMDENYRYQLIIDCESEEHQSKLIDQFKKEGLKCRPLIL